MPRANRYIVAGPAYHVTHRCHNRDFLLRFAKERDAYREMLRIQLGVHRDVQALTYCITSNHVHLLLVSRRSDESISAFMHDVEGQFAQAHNRRKKRSGAFWGDRFHATMIDSGEYLWRCMRYIDLNMVRAGVVSHPSEWPWTGYTEIAGVRKRYRVVSMEALCERAQQADAQAVRSWYTDWIDSASSVEAMEREGKWTESIAVGRKEFVEAIGRNVEDRMKVEAVDDGVGGWLLREERGSYSHFSGPKKGCNDPERPFLDA